MSSSHIKKKKKCRIVIVNKPTIKDPKRRFFRKHIFLHPLTVVDIIVGYLGEDNDLSYFIQAVHELDDEIKIFKPNTVMKTTNIDGRRLSYIADIGWLQHLSVIVNSVKGGSACISHISRMTSLLTLQIGSTIPNKHWKGFEAINSLTSLQSLTLSNLKFDGDKEILFSKELTLQSIALINCKITFNLMESVGSLSSLTSLDLSSTTIPINPIIFESAPGELGKISYRNATPNLVNLRRLTLKKCDSLISFINGLPNPSILEYVNIDDSRCITSESEMKVLVGLTGVKELSLCYNTYPYLNIISLVSTMKQLKLLNLTGWRWDNLVQLRDQIISLLIDLKCIPGFNAIGFPVL